VHEFSGGAEPGHEETLQGGMEFVNHNKHFLDSNAEGTQESATLSQFPMSSLRSLRPCVEEYSSPLATLCNYPE